MVTRNAQNIASPRWSGALIDDAQIALAKSVPIERIADERNIRLRGNVERVGPCPVCGGDDRFAINVRKQVWNCRGCQIGGDVIRLVQHLDGVDFRTAFETLIGQVPTQNCLRPRPNLAWSKSKADDHERAQRRKADWLWQHRQPIAGTPAETYLRQVRGYRGEIPPTLAYLPPSRPEHYPALISAFALVDEVEPGFLAIPRNVDAVHLTLLRADGTDKAAVKDPKLVVGRPLGRPIVLAPPNDLLGLAVTEGIEDGLTVYQATALGVWVAGSAGMMPSLADAVPSYIEVITVFSHAERSGQVGAIDLAERLYARGFEVLIEGDAS